MICYIDARNQLLSIFKKLRLQKNPEFAFIEVYDDNSFELNARVVKEVVELLQPYQFRYGHKQQFLTLFDLNGEYVVDSHITILRIDTEKAIPKYVMYSLANYGFKNIEKLATGQSGQIELSYDAINNITISLPIDITIQKEIVAKMQNIENKITELKKEKKDLLEKKNAILDEYI